jgi:hypothetical protein
MTGKEKAVVDIIPEGAMAKVVQAHDSGEDYIVRDGTKFIVYVYVSAEQSEDGQAYYVGHSNGGWCNITALAGYVVQVMTPEQVKNRKIPTANKLANSLISSITGSYGPFFIHTGGPARGNEVEFEGTTSEGLEFGFKVSITELGQVEE